MKTFDNVYLETPLAKNLDFFKTHLEDNRKEHWSAQSVEIIQDAYCVGISEMWVESKLLADSYFEIYKQIITRCRLLTIEALRRGNDVWKEQLKMLQSRYQVDLLKVLTNAIRDYCMEI